MIAKTMVIGYVLTLAALGLWKLADTGPQLPWDVAMIGIVAYWLFKFVM